MKETREIVPSRLPERRELERPIEPAVVAGNYPMYRGAEVAEGLQLMDYWRAIRKRLWLVLGITVLATTLAAIYMARKPDIFQARAQVQVDQEQANPDLVTSDRRPLTINSDPAYFNTQLQLLTSDSLLRKVITNLDLENNKEFQKSKAEEANSTTASILRSLGLATKDDKKNGEGGIVEVSSVSGMSGAGEIENAVKLAPDVQSIRLNMAVEPVRESRNVFKDTRLIEVTYRHSNPALAATIVNGVAEAFVKTNQEKRSGTSEKTNDFLEEKIADYQTQIRKDEQALVDLQQDAGVLKTTPDTTVETERLAALSKQKVEAENQRQLAEAQYRAIVGSPERLRALAEEQMSRDITERESYLRNFEMQVNRNIADLKAERQRLLVEYTEAAPEVQEVDRRISELEKAIAANRQKVTSDVNSYRKQTEQTILTNLKTKYDQTRTKEDAVRRDYDEQYNKAQGQNNSQINIRILEDRLKANKEFLASLVKQQRENNVISVGSDNNISVVDIAIPPEKPVAPSRLSTVLLVMILSTLFGMGLALFLEYLDDSIKTTEQLENLLQMPALAAIPTIDSMPKRKLLLVGAEEDGKANAKSELLIHSDSRSSLAEAYRQLRTSVLLSTAGHAPKSLLVTSSLPSEGKTTTAINTAISLAQTGASVLIIDADMRRPRLHSVFNISNAQGLSTILSSEMNEAEVMDIVQYQESAKLHMLPSGPVPPNPAELIGSEQMTNLLKTLEGNYTHVIVDSPPIASFTDGVLIASMVDGVILVVNAGKSSRQVVKRSRQLLLDIGAKIFGVVLNNANLRAQDNYYYQSYYHRTYYRHEDED
jgi:capsular exopolysaccharide synthesis family protein